MVYMVIHGNTWYNNYVNKIYTILVVSAFSETFRQCKKKNIFSFRASVKNTQYKTRQKQVEVLHKKEKGRRWVKSSGFSTKYKKGKIICGNAEATKRRTQNFIQLLFELWLDQGLLRKFSWFKKKKKCILMSSVDF